MEKKDKIKIKGIIYTIIRVLGECNLAHIYLAYDGYNMYTLKDYSPLGENAKKSVISECDSYNILIKLNVNMPKLISYDEDKGIIIKEYIDGEDASLLLMKTEMKSKYLDQLRSMVISVEKSGYALNYFPTYYVVGRDKLYYIHYEFDSLNVDNSFDNYGVKYWLNSANLINKVVN